MNVGRDTIANLTNSRREGRIQKVLQVYFIAREIYMRNMHS